VTDEDGTFRITAEAAAAVDKDEELRMATAMMLLDIEAAQNSPIGLYKLLFTDEQGQPIIIKWFHEEWNELVLSTKPEDENILICASRELTKTSYMLAVCAWLIGKNRNIRIKWLSSDNETAKKRLAVIHAILDSDLYKWIFPDVRKLTDKESKDEKRPNTTTALNVVRDFLSPEYTVEASGILSTGVGGRADLIICDDVVSESNALLNPSVRPKVINKFLSDWLSTLIANGRCFYIGSPWHVDDLMGYLKRKKGWQYREYKHGKPGDIYFSIFPERWPREKLIQRRDSLGPVHYARAYLCQPLHEGTVAVPPSALLLYSKRELTQDILVEATAILSMDPSSGKQLQSGKLDFTGVCIFLFYQIPEDKYFKIFIPDAYQVRLPHVMQAKLFWQLVKQWNAAYAVVEAAGMQSLHEWIEEQRVEDPRLPLVDINPIAPGNINKGQRLMRVSPLLGVTEGRPELVHFHPAVVQEAPQPFFMNVGDVPFEASRTLRNQVVGFPADHDDVLDAFTYGLFWIHNNLVQLGEESENQKAPSFMAIGI
jgi:hypothetical protein